MFIAISYCTATILNNNNNRIKKCGKRIFEHQSNDYSIIYNNDYAVVNTKTFENYKESIDISELANIKKSKQMKNHNLNSFPG